MTTWLKLLTLEVGIMVRMSKSCRVKFRKLEESITLDKLKLGMKRKADKLSLSSDEKTVFRHRLYTCYDK